MYTVIRKILIIFKDVFYISAEEDQGLIPENMDNDCVGQCWFRFLHTLGSPVDLSRPQVIGNTTKFLHMALTSETVLDPHKHECLHVLPKIFHRAMKSVAVLVDAFLGNFFIFVVLFVYEAFPSPWYLLRTVTLQA